MNDVAYNKVIFCRLSADDNNVQDSSNNSKFIENNLKRISKNLRKGLENGLLNLSWQNKTMNSIAQKGSRTSFSEFCHCPTESVSNKNHLWIVFSVNLRWTTYMDISECLYLICRFFISRISTLFFSFNIYLNRLFLVMTIYKHWTKNF